MAQGTKAKVSGSVVAGWYAQREWQSPHGYKRLPRHLWPERTWWQDVLSYF